MMRLGLRREFHGVHGIEIQRGREEPNHEKHHHIGDGHQFGHVDPIGLARHSGTYLFISCDSDVSAIEWQNRREVDETKEDVDRGQ